MKMISLLLLILSSCLCAATFVVNVTQSSYEAEENHSITLEWTFTTRTQGSYRELFIYCSLLVPHKELVLYQVHEGVEIPESQDEQFSGRVQIDKDVLREGRIRLHVSRLRTEDSGLYLCGVKTEDGVGSARCRLDVSENYHLVGSDEPIEGRVGSNVVLPCLVKPPVDVKDMAVKWMFDSSDTVHLFRSGGDDPDNQGKRYKGRTYFNHTMLEHGDISLKLANVTKDDEGIYTCNVRQLPGLDNSEERNVVLVVVDGNENPDRSSGGTDEIIGGVVGGLLLLGFIICCVVCCKRGKQKQSGNGNPGDEPEGIPLQVVEQPNQRVDESSPLS